MSAEAARIAEEAARAGGAIVRAAALGERDFSLRHKGAIDMVTEVDLAAEEVVCEMLQRLAPGIPIQAEERGGEILPTRWLVDPLDGTTNFVHGFPSFAVSIGLVVEGQLKAGCVYDPLRENAYVAALGCGATKDGAPIHVSKTPDLSHALLLTGFSYDRRERADFYLTYFKAFMERAQGLRRAGAAAMDLVYIATGQADGMWEFGLNAWDVAAGTLLVSEAGGRVTDMGGGPMDLDRPRLLASNGSIHDAMAAVLQPLLSSDALGEAGSPEAVE